MENHPLTFTVSCSVQKSPISGRILSEPVALHGSSKMEGKRKSRPFSFAGPSEEVAKALLPFFSNRYDVLPSAGFNKPSCVVKHRGMFSALLGLCPKAIFKETTMKEAMVWIHQHQSEQWLRSLEEEHVDDWAKVTSERIRAGCMIITKALNRPNPPQWIENLTIPEKAGDVGGDDVDDLKDIDGANAGAQSTWRTSRGSTFFLGFERDLLQAWRTDEKNLWSGRKISENPKAQTRTAWWRRIGPTAPATRSRTSPSKSGATSNRRTG